MDKKDAVNAMLNKLGIDRNSKFYDYIARSLWTGYEIKDVIRKLENSSPQIRSIESSLIELDRINNSITNTRYSHYNMLRNAKSKRPIEARVDANGKSYMDSDALVKADGRVHKGINEIDKCLKIYDLATANKISGLLQDELQEILDMDIRVKEQSKIMENIIEDGRRHYTSKGKNARQMANKRNKIIALSVAGVLGIVGINRMFTLNKPVDSEIQPATTSIEQMIEEGKVIRINSQTSVNIAETNTRSTSTLSPTYSDSTSQYYEIMSERNKSQVGKYEANVEKMPEDLVGYLATSIRESEKYIPNAIVNVEAYRNINDDKEVVKKFFRNLDLYNSSDIDATSVAYQMGPVLDTLLKYKIMQDKDGKVTMDEMDFYFRYGSNQSASSVSLQKVRINSKGNKERVEGVKYYINGDSSSKNKMVQLSLARGTFGYVLGDKEHSAKIGFAEIDNNGIINQAFDIVNDNLMDLLNEIEKGKEIER